MSQTLDRLLKSNGLFCVDLRTGTTKDVVGNLTPTIVGSPIMTQGQGMYVPTWSGAGQFVHYGNNHNLSDATQPRTWVTRITDFNVPHAAYVTPISKVGSGAGWTFNINGGGFPQFKIIDASAASLDVWTQVTMIAGKSATLVVTYMGSLTGAGLKIYVDGVEKTVGTSGTIANTVSNSIDLRVGGYPVSTFQSVPSKTELVAILNRVLTPLEIAQISEEIRLETSPGLLDSPKRNYFFPYKTLSPAQATTQGLVLDTDFVRSSDGKVRNFAPTANTGTVVGTPVPANNGEGMTFSGTASAVSMGDFAALNGAKNLTFSFTIRLPSTGVVTNGAIFGKTSLISGGRFIVQVTSNSPGPHRLQYYEIKTTVGASQLISTLTVLYPGVDHHITIVRDGDGATDTDKVKMYVDGSQVAATSAAGPFQTTTDPSLSGYPLDIGREFAGNNPLAMTIRNLRIRTVSLTAAQIRAEYLEKAKELITDGRLYENGATPLTLAKITEINAKIPGTIWQGKNQPYLGIDVINSNNKRWMYNVSAGYHSRVWANDHSAFGSWYFECQWENVLRVIIGALNPLEDGGTDLGYKVDMSGNQIRLITPSGGTLLTSAGSQNTMYRYWVSRTSTSVWSLWAKGGAFTNWTLLGTATDATQTTGNFAAVTMYGATIHFGDFLHFAGAMTPAEAIGLGLIDP